MSALLLERDVSTIRILLEICRVFWRARAVRTRCIPFTAPPSRRMVPTSMWVQPVLPATGISFLLSNCDQTGIGRLGILFINSRRLS